MGTQARRWTLIVSITFAVALIGGFAAFQLAIQALKGQVESALGPHGEVKEIRVSLTGIEAIGIRIRAPQSVIGMPRNAAVAMMKNRNGKISVKFALEGNINDPRFSLNKNLTTRIGTSLAETLGINIEDLAKGVGGIGSRTVKDLIDSFGNLNRK